MGKTGGLKRKSLRLRGHDYTHEGGYFITLVAHNRECIFGTVAREKFELFKYGEIAREEWFASEVNRDEI